MFTWKDPIKLKRNGIVKLCNMRWVIETRYISAVVHNVWHSSKLHHSKFDFRLKVAGFWKKAHLAQQMGIVLVNILFFLLWNHLNDVYF